MRKGAAKTIAPYSAIHEDGGNVATLAHFFRCLPTSGGSHLLDSKGGVVWEVPGGGYDSALNAVTTTAEQNTAVSAVVSGMLTSFAAGESGLLVAAGRINLLGASVGPRFALGDVNTAGRAGFGVAPARLHSAIGNYASYARVSAPGNGAPIMGAVWLDSSVYTATPTLTLRCGEITGQASTTVITAVMSTGSLVDFTVTTDNGDYTAGGYVEVTGGAPSYLDPNRTLLWKATNGGYDVDTAGLDVVLVSKYQPDSILLFQVRNAITGALLFDVPYYHNAVRNAGAFTLWNGMRFSGLDLYGAALFKFSGALPDDADTAAWWMGTSWKNNERYIYPSARSWV